MDSNDMMANMLQIIYASAAKKPFSREDLIALLKVARKKNTDAGISGMLTYHNGSFLQVLEGPEKSVEELYLIIEKDQRHHRCVLLSRETIQAREFENWSMGFVDTTRVAATIEGFVDYAKQLGTMSLDKAGAHTMLRRFQSGQWRRAEFL